MRKKKTSKQIFYKVEITDAGAKGVCVAKSSDGKIIFVSNVVPGDVVDIETFKKRKSYYEGKAIHFHSFSKDRVAPVCKHFTVCGGCKWQNMTYEKQLYYKNNEVYNNLKRIAKVSLPTFDEIKGSENIYFYRNKMEFGFSNSRWITQEEKENNVEIQNKNALGFHIPKMWDKILDIEKCHLQQDPSNLIRNSIRTFAIENNLSFFDVKNQNGLLRTLMIRNTSKGELMVLIQFYENNLQSIKLIMNYLANTFPKINSLLYVINTKPNDTLYDQEIICYKGNPYITEEMEGLQFRIQAKSFYQTNSHQAYELYKITRDFAGLSGKETVYDLYTGTGTIALFVAKNAKKVIGIEAVNDAIEDAKINAKYNNLTNCAFFVGDMKNVFTEEFILNNGNPDVIITDPPRDGMHQEVIKQIINVAPQKIVYVSCNSATQARDLSLLDSHYKVMRVQPVDMFPQTHHVENVVLLEKR